MNWAVPANRKWTIHRRISLFYYFFDVGFFSGFLGRSKWSRIVTNGKVDALKSFVFLKWAGHLGVASVLFEVYLGVILDYLWTVIINLEANIINLLRWATAKLNSGHDIKSIGALILTLACIDIGRGHKVRRALHIHIDSCIRIVLETVIPSQRLLPVVVPWFRLLLLPLVSRANISLFQFASWTTFCFQKLLIWNLIIHIISLHYFI